MVHVAAGTLKMRDMKLRDMKMLHHVAGVESARHENARNAIVWNTACCICLSIAEQECMSRQERAPDFLSVHLLRRICAKCVQRDARLAFVPCGHQRFCASCHLEQQARGCPICRSEITMVLRLY